MSWQPHRYRRGELVVVIDCGDLERAARFWAGVLGYIAVGDAEGVYQALTPADGSGIEVLLQPPPEYFQKDEP